MLATLTHQYFSHEDWIYERKLDGLRCLALKAQGQVTLYSRNEKKLNATYPELVAAFEKQPTDNFLIDGKIVALDTKRCSFSLLQKRMNVQNPTQEMLDIPIFFYAFDLPFEQNQDLRKKPLISRKNRLKQLLKFTGPLRFCKHQREKGEKYFQEACRKHGEGLIAKKIDGPYLSKRSRLWLKFTCQNRQEFVIGG